MKNLLVIVLSVFFISSTYDLKAQNRKVRTNNGKVVVRKSTKPSVYSRVNTRSRSTPYYRQSPYRRGSIVSSIHPSARRVSYRGSNYRYHSGTWYRPSGHRWVVVIPPIGIRVGTLPRGCRRVIIHNRPYYYQNGTYYSQYNNEYRVVESPLASYQEPVQDNYQTVYINGIQYLTLDGVYYLSSVDEAGEQVLIAVDDPRI